MAYEPKLPCLFLPFGFGSSELYTPPGTVKPAANVTVTNNVPATKYVFITSIKFHFVFGGCCCRKRNISFTYTGTPASISTRLARSCMEI